MYGDTKTRFYISMQLMQADRNSQITSRSFESMYDIKFEIIKEIAYSRDIQKWISVNKDKVEEFWKIMLEGNLITENTEDEEIEHVIRDCKKLVRNSPNNVIEELKTKLAPKFQEDKKAELQELMNEDAQLDVSLHEAKQLLQAYEQQAKEKEQEQK